MFYVVLYEVFLFFPWLTMSSRMTSPTWFKAKSMSMSKQFDFGAFLKEVLSRQNISVFSSSGMCYRLFHPDVNAYTVNEFIFT